MAACIASAPPPAPAACFATRSSPERRRRWRLLLAQGVAYVRFARQNPELYRIATMTNGRPGSDVETSVTGSAFARLRAAVQALIDAGGYAPVDAATAALELWSAVHGVASLQIAEPQLPFGDIEALTTTVLRAICLGRRAAAPTDDVATT